MRAAIYARKSGKDGREGEDKSVASQIETCRTFAERHGWVVDDQYVFVDEVTGADYTERREGFTKLNALLTPTRSKSWKPPFDVLVVFEASRIGRDLVGNLRFEQRVAAAGVRLWDASRNRDITIVDSHDKMSRAFDASSAEAVIDDTSRRVRRAQADKWRDGHVVGGKVFGYTNVTTVEPAAAAKMKHPVKNSRREIDEREAAVVRRIFELVASGRGYDAIRKILADEKAPSPRGRGWTAKGVKLVVNRSDYRGVEVRGKTVRVRREDENGNPRWFQVASDNAQQRACPAIVSEELWDAAHARIARTARAVAKPDGTVRPSSGLAAPNLLSGFLLCGRCHGSMTILNFHSTQGPPSLK